MVSPTRCAAMDEQRSQAYLSLIQERMNRCQALDLPVMNPTYFITEVDYEG
ncbi:hypothetical protein [Arthrospira sp. PCC 8006]|uniref:hypothetical protein n=1 Tax=Oscillatoriales TaxID=1150 RepID=UPI00396F46FB